MMRYGQTQRGFTLVEMIIVIVITGIISGMVAMFIRAPVQGYIDSSRRADISDIADTALLRMARDLRTAVPNSVRMPTPVGSFYVEFMPTVDGGRYRVNRTGGSAACNAVPGDKDGAAFAFGNDNCFEIIGAPMSFNVGDAIVIGSAQAEGNLPYVDPATVDPFSPIGEGKGVRRMVSVAGTTVVRINTAGAAPFPHTAEKQEGHRFTVVSATEQAVTYACVGIPGVDPTSGDGTMTLMRYWGYDFRDPQITPDAIAALGLPGKAVLATNVSACNFVYDTSNYSNSLVAVRLEITRNNESARLYQEIHINNIP